MKRLLTIIIASSLLVACGSGEEDVTVCEDFTWGESCITVHREMKSGTYVGGTALIEQTITDESFGFVWAEAYITWECDEMPTGTTDDLNFQTLSLDGILVDPSEYILDDHLESAWNSNECVIPQ